MRLSCNQVNTLSVQYSANNWLEHCCKGQIDKFDHFIDPIDNKYNLRYLSLTLLGAELPLMATFVIDVIV